MQTVRAGTHDQIFGPGSTPSYMSPTVAFKYLDDAVVQLEQGWKLDFLVSFQIPSLMLSIRLDLVVKHCTPV